MNVLLINGSPHKKGCTYTALSEVAGQLEKNGIGSNIVHIGSKPIRGCIACGACRETGLCVFERRSGQRVAHGLLKAADGLIVGSPVYYAAPKRRAVRFLGSPVLYEKRRPTPTSPLPPWSAAPWRGQRGF